MLKENDNNDCIGIAKATFLKYEILVNNDSKNLLKEDCDEIEKIGRDLGQHGNFQT